jgi:hypothetical protein
MNMPSAIDSICGLGSCNFFLSEVSFFILITTYLKPGSGSGSVRQRYGSGSFFTKQKKIVRKTLISTVLLLLFDFFSLKNDVNIPSKSNKQKSVF